MVTLAPPESSIVRGNAAAPAAGSASALPPSPSSSPSSHATASSASATSASDARHHPPTPASIPQPSMRRPWMRGPQMRQAWTRRLRIRRARIRSIRACVSQLAPPSTRRDARARRARTTPSGARGQAGDDATSTGPSAACRRLSSQGLDMARAGALAHRAACGSPRRAAHSCGTAPDSHRLPQRLRRARR